jgi:hypothetical protein
MHQQPVTGADTPAGQAGDDLFLGNFTHFYER